ncbi:MAG: copper amine oxidase N-terminal domain-containing protein [Armatimonadota bacterium]
MPYMIQGKAQTLETEPFVQNGKHYIPLRDVVQALGGSVSFDNDTKMAQATIGPWTAALTMGDENVTVSGNGTNTPVTLTAPPYVEEEQFFVPFDFLRDAYGYDVSFEGETLNIVNPNAV